MMAGESYISERMSEVVTSPEGVMFGAMCIIIGFIAGMVILERIDASERERFAKLAAEEERRRRESFGGRRLGDAEDAARRTP